MSFGISHIGSYRQSWLELAGVALRCSLMLPRVAVVFFFFSVRLLLACCVAVHVSWPELTSSHRVALLFLPF